MNPEHNNQPDQAIHEHQRDRDLIEENRALFWLVSTVACEQSEYGAIVVDMREPPTGGGYPFSYLTKGEIDFEDEHLGKLLREYNPHREFVVAFVKHDENLNVYLGKAPQIGWWDSMTAK